MLASCHVHQHHAACSCTQLRPAVARRSCLATKAQNHLLFRQTEFNRFQSPEAGQDEANTGRKSGGCSMSTWRTPAAPHGLCTGVHPRRCKALTMMRTKNFLSKGLMSGIAGTGPLRSMQPSLSLTSVHVHFVRECSSTGHVAPIASPCESRRPLGRW